MAASNGPGAVSGFGVNLISGSEGGRVGFLFIVIGFSGKVSLRLFLFVRWASVPVAPSTYGFFVDWFLGS